MPDFIQLNRTFSSFTSNSGHSKNGEIDWEQYMFSGSTASSWNDLLKKRNVVILAEAGAGKTEELRAITTQLHNDGLPAFFCRLEGLQEDDFDVQDWEIGSSRAFDQWRRDDSVVAYFFLDSVDEARLVDQRAFWRALRRFVRVIGRDYLHRAHVYVTSRFSEWRPLEDLKTFRDAFSLSDSAVESEEPESDIVYKLDALSNEQIRHFASAQQVVEPQAFIDEIERADARLFAGRPQDLLDLITYWQGNNQQLGSYGEIVAFSVDRKLQERHPDRATQTQLTLENAYAGASYLAAAVTFTKNNKIALPSSSNSPSDHLDVQRVLRSWTRENIEGLLSRPLFDEAIYGAVRFHHRSVREYLTAKWLYGLLEQGAPRHKIEALLIAEQYGVKVAIPSMQVVAAWLAFFDERFRFRLMEYAPEVLIQHGDPSVFPLEFRIRLLDGVIEKYQDQQRTDLYIDPAMMTRLSEPDMANAINHRLPKYIENKSVCRLLLYMVQFGNVIDAIEEVSCIALNSGVDEYTRRGAFEAILAIGNDQQKRLVIGSLMLQEDTVGREIIGSECIVLFPSFLSVGDLLQIIRVFPQEDMTSNEPAIRDSIEYLATEDVSTEKLLLLLAGISDLIAFTQRSDDRAFGRVNPYWWLLEPATKMTQKIIERGVFVEKSISLLSILFEQYNNGAYHRLSDELSKTLEKHQHWARELFWFAVEQERLERRPSSSFWAVSSGIQFVWKVTLDQWNGLLTDLKNRDLENERLIALDALLLIINENIEGKEKLLASLQEAMLEKPSVALQERFYQWLNPIPPTKEEQARQKKNKERDQQREHQEQKEQREREFWVTHLQAKLDDWKVLGVPEQGVVWEEGQYLYKNLANLEKNRRTLGISKWELLIPYFGQLVAEAFRDGCLAYWRLHPPATSSTQWGSVIALCGLAIESTTSGWSNVLSDEEAELAVRYAQLEREVPDWLIAIQESHPQAMVNVFAIGIKCELSVSFTDSFSTVLQRLFFSEKLNACLFHDVLLAELETLKDFDGVKHECIQYALGLFLKSKRTNEVSKRVIALATDRLSKSEDLDIKVMWLIVLLSIRGDLGLSQLGVWLSELSDQEQSNLVSKVLSELQYGVVPDHKIYSPSFMQKQYLNVLLDLALKHIRYPEDFLREHSGSYRSGTRERSQRVRENYIKDFAMIPGEFTYRALLNWADSVQYKRASDDLKYFARHRAEADAEYGAWQVEDVARFADEHAVTPHSEQALYRFAVAKLEELKAEYEQGDDSIARTMQRIDQETELRNYLAHQLRQRAHGHYEVPQEEEMPDATRPDLKFRVTGVQPIPVELKIVDNWSFNELNERLENQLLGQYMRTSKYGIYLLVFRGKKSYWQDQGNNQYSFNEMLNVLRQQADLLLNTHPRLEGISVIGIDLKRRFSS